MTTNLILELLYNNSWFIHSKSANIINIPINGIDIEVPISYYHLIQNTNYIILMRVSNHCTYLETWIRSKLEPEKSILNLSIVLSDIPCTYNKKTRPIRIKGVDTYKYFVLEQYTYKLSNLSKSDFLKIIKRLYRLETEQIVYTDPLKKKPNKRARRDILTPDDKKGNPISPDTNEIHKRQTIVLNNKDNEIDFGGNILEKQKLYESIMRDVSKLLKNI